MNYKLYKDAEPRETISRIKNILTTNKIYVSESPMEGFDGIFSVRLTINGSEIGTNGKGVTREAAYASAYAELIERIQNFALYKFMYPAKDHLSDAPFYYAPDEIAVPVNESSDYMKVFATDVALNEISDSDMLAIHTRYERDNQIFCCIPYINMSTQETVLVPARLCEHIYASNGMAAGNTYTEALVQSISEIFERYANKEIFNGKVIPPEIKLEDINFSPEMREVIHKLSLKGNYTISFRDCSLGLGLPVVGLFFIDRSTGKYFVKFGCHPILSIAAERTITELFQGRDFSRIHTWLNVFTFSTELNYAVVFEGIFRNGDGIYPYKVFTGANSYNFSDCWCKTKNPDNEVFLSYLLSIIEKNNWNLYHRDVSFLGFPSLHAFIPEISSIICMNKQYLDKNIRFKQIKGYLLNLERCNKEEMKAVVDFIDNNYYSDYESIKRLTGLPLNANSNFNQTNNLCFKYLLCCRDGEYKRGIENLDKFIKESYLPLEDLAFYRCLREATYAMHIQNLDINETGLTLNTMFDSELVRRIMSILLYHQFEVFTCPECDSCNSKSACFYPQICHLDTQMTQKYLAWKKG
ncbi:MAG: YcaO-like family protein [Dehalococcoidia bacterium]|nr:YcaO-like family protein [Dehalococcoidia bacterium]